MANGKYVVYGRRHDLFMAERNKPLRVLARAGVLYEPDAEGKRKVVNIRPDRAFCDVGRRKEMNKACVSFELTDEPHDRAYCREEIERIQRYFQELSRAR